MSALLAACGRNASPLAPLDASSDGTTATLVPPCVPAPAAPPGSARPDLREARLTAISGRPASLVDLAPGRPPDADHPAGTVYVASVLDNGSGRGAATLFEWDVASARTIDAEGRLLYRESDKEDNGKSSEVRIVTTREDVFMAVTLEQGRFTVLGRSPLAHGNDNLRADHLPPARNISLATDGRWLAVAYERTSSSGPGAELPRTGILLYDVSTMKRVASTPFGQSREMGVRHDNLEILDGRLFAAEPAGAKVRVVELALPSLSVVRTVEVSTPDRSSRAQLTSVRGHLVALSGDLLVELTPGLEVVGTRALHAGEVALGPAAEILTPVGLEAPGRRGDFVPEVRASASCTPAWTGAYPILACTVDMRGVRMARLAPVRAD